MAAIDKLHKARSMKNDEFYTQLDDVAAEAGYYGHHFRDKVVLCNCDNPERSAFWEYFHVNFERLELKKLVSTYHGRNACVTEYSGGNDEDLAAGIRTQLAGNGDFRSQECIEILDRCDIVVTNPPFSLFREYIGQLVEHNKKFLIIGNMNAVTYKEIFPLIRDDKVWYGASITGGDRKFNVPDNYPLDASGCGIDSDGRKFIKVKGVRWFTNLDHAKRHDKLTLYKKYTPLEYPKYDGYDAINVNRTADIPMDYEGVMGVPISFLDKYCPEQFEILGDSRFHDGQDFSDDINYLNGKLLYRRLLIRRRA